MISGSPLLYRCILNRNETPDEIAISPQLMLQLKKSSEEHKIGPV
jgi:hypothetical protein